MHTYIKNQLHIPCSAPIPPNIASRDHATAITTHVRAHTLLYFLTTKVYAVTHSPAFPVQRPRHHERRIRRPRHRRHHVMLHRSSRQHRPAGHVPHAHPPVRAPAHKPARVGRVERDRRHEIGVRELLQAHQPALPADTFSRPHEVCARASRVFAYAYSGHCSGRADGFCCCFSSPTFMPTHLLRAPMCTTSSSNHPSCTARTHSTHTHAHTHTHVVARSQTMCRCTVSMMRVPPPAASPSCTPSCTL